MTTVPGKVARFKVISLSVLSLVVIVVDQWTKYLIHSRFRWGESVGVIQNLFALTYVRNTGAAFGLLHRAPSWFRDPFFILVPVVALFVILFILMTLPPDQKKAVVGLSLVFGGAIGNLIDRLRFGYVIDFLDFHWKEVYHWPAFNVADSSIVVGVGLMFLLSLFQGKSQLPASSPLSRTASAGD
jgi:signal peptidase II